MNAWLGIVTLLHHTDVDVPHLEEEWNYIPRRILTIDGPHYYKIVDWVQHHIGSTRSAHPHQPQGSPLPRAGGHGGHQEAFPDLYLHDPTPVHVALWRVVTNCISVKKVTNPTGSRQWVYDDPTLPSVKKNNRVF